MIALVAVAPTTTVGPLSGGQRLLGTGIGIGAFLVTVTAFVWLAIRVNRKEREHHEILEEAEGEKP